MAEPHVGPATPHGQLRLEDVLEGDEVGFPLPDVESRVLAMLREPDADPAELEAVLAQDPLLAGKLLRMVNSSLYGLSQEVSAVRHAIMVVGFRGLRSLSLASGVNVSLRRYHAVCAEDNGELARHATCVAAAARELGRLGKTGIHREELFVAGLLHDIGRVPLAPHLGGQTAALYGPELIAAERQLTGLDHAQVGAELCRRWNVGRAIAEIVACHHGVPGSEALAGAVVAVRIADQFVHMLDAAAGGAARVDGEMLSQLASIGIDREHWEAAVPRVEEAVAAAVHSLAD